MGKGLGNKLIESAKNGEIEKLRRILNQNANIVNYDNGVGLIFFKYFIFLLFLYI